MAETVADRQLLREFVERGSEGAFETLVQRHVDLVFATVFRRFFQFPVEPGTTLWNYRHLFGDQPLIPLPTKPPRQQE